MGHRLNQQTSSRERTVQGTPTELWPGFLQRDLYPLTPPKQLSLNHHILKKDKQPSVGKNKRGRKMKGKKIARMEITRPNGNEEGDFSICFMTGHLALCFKRTLWNPNWDLFLTLSIKHNETIAWSFSASEFASSDNVRKKSEEKAQRPLCICLRLTNPS